MRRRQAAYAIVAVLGFGVSLLPNFAWEEGERLHAIIEAVAASVALLVGAIALLHHHARKNNRLLFVGAAFLGTGLLDGYHALLTSAWLERVWPTPPGAFGAWSWTASRLFLGSLLLLGWWNGRREERHGPAARVNGAAVYLTLFAALQIVIALLAVVPLPEAVRPGAAVPRPQELLPAALFLCVLVAALAGERWKTDPLEHWFVLALILAFVGEAFCAPFSAAPLDGKAQLAHGLKNLSYLCVLVGVLWSVYAHLRQVRDNAVALATWNAELERRVADRTALLEAEIAKRRKIQRSLECEGGIAADLARAGRELISSLESPVLLDRLCQITAEVLGCDQSITLLWRPADNAFEPVASFGLTAEEKEALRVVKVPREVMSVLLKRLENDDVAEVNTVPMDVVPEERQSSVESNRYLSMALRAGREIIGVQSAGRRRSADAFGQTQYRLARGIAQLASLALHNSRLYEELQRAIRLKSEFVATMSHELRTPLNVILGYHDLLLHGDFGALAPEQSEALERANKSAEDLFHLVGGVLDLSRLGREDTPLEVEEVEAGALMREVVSTVEASGDKPSLDLFCETADTPLPLRTDRMKLRLVLGNLLGNAVKFTERGTVSLGAAEREGGIEFRVADTGIGIPAEILPVIFEPFRQGREGVDRYYGGVGLGLYIVRRLVDVLGGEISVESRVGEGSVFRVWLPNAVNGARSGAGFDPGASPSNVPAHAA